MPTKDDWNKIEITIPPEREEVLLTDGLFIALCYRYDNVWHLSYSSTPYQYKATHWMALPEIPSND